MFERVRRRLKSQVPVEKASPTINEPPLHWGTREGEVIKAIVLQGRPLTYKEIRQETGLDDDSLHKALKNLFSPKISKHDMQYRVSPELYTEYTDFLNSQKETNELINWINQWKEVRKLNFSLEHGHFFLEGMHLDDFSKQLISHAKKDVLLVNPFVTDCDLSNTLREANKRGIKVKIFTRPPKDANPEYRRIKSEYHLTLEKEGITLRHSEKVHAKLIVIDHAVAIASSMNFYAESSAGVSWEAGLVSINEDVVRSTVNSTLSRLV